MNVISSAHLRTVMWHKTCENTVNTVALSLFFFFCFFMIKTEISERCWKEKHSRSCCLSGFDWWFFCSSWSRSGLQGFSSEKTGAQWKPGPDHIQPSRLNKRVSLTAYVCVSLQRTLSSSKRRVKWRISANCLASACSLSKCWVGMKGGHVSFSNKLFRASSADTSTRAFKIPPTHANLFQLLWSPLMSSNKTSYWTYY